MSFDCLDYSTISGNSKSSLCPKKTITRKGSIGYIKEPLGEVSLNIEHPFQNQRLAKGFAEKNHLVSETMYQRKETMPEASFATLVTEVDEKPQKMRRVSQTSYTSVKKPSQSSEKSKKDDCFARKGSIAASGEFDFSDPQAFFLETMKNLNITIEVMRMRDQEYEGQIASLIKTKAESQHLIHKLERKLERLQRQRAAEPFKELDRLNTEVDSLAEEKKILERMARDLLHEKAQHTDNLTLRDSDKSLIINDESAVEKSVLSYGVAMAMQQNESLMSFRDFAQTEH